LRLNSAILSFTSTSLKHASQHVKRFQGLAQSLACRQATDSRPTLTSWLTLARATSRITIPRLPSSSRPPQWLHHSTKAQASCGWPKASLCLRYDRSRSDSAVEKPTMEDLFTEDISTARSKLSYGASVMRKWGRALGSIGPVRGAKKLVLGCSGVRLWAPGTTVESASSHLIASRGTGCPSLS
jgi:hypothetical protein